MGKKQRQSKINRLIPAAGLAYLVYWFATKAKAVENLNYEVKGFRVKGIQLTDTNGQLDFLVTNPSGRSLKFSDIFLQLFYQGERLATIESPSLLILDPRTSTVLPLDVRISHTSLIAKGVGSLIKFFKDGTPVEGIVMKGSARVDGVSYPIEEVFPLSIKSDG